MKVGKTGRVFFNLGPTMGDSGTTFTYLGTKAYRNLKSGIESYCQQHSSCGARLQGKQCWNVQKGLKSFPAVEMQFGKVLMQWQLRAYLYRRGSSTQWCYSF